METSSQDFDFRDGFLRRVLVRQQPFNEARNSVSSNGRLAGQDCEALTRPGLPGEKCLKSPSQKSTFRQLGLLLGW